MQKISLEYPPHLVHETIQGIETHRNNPDELQEPSYLKSLDSVNDVHPNQTIESNKRNRKVVPLFLLVALMTLPHLSFSYDVLPLYYNSIILLMIVIILSRLMITGINRGRVVRPEEEEFHTGFFLYAVLCVFFSWKVINLGFLLTFFLGLGFQELAKDEQGIFKNTSPLNLDFLSIKYLNPLSMMLQVSCALTFFL